MAKKFLTEREGQIKFFEDLRIDTEVELSNNTDGVFKGTLFEFKLNISDINKVLFQSIKYLSHLRIKGESVPKNILLVSLNTETAYLFDSECFINEIEQIYIGAASRNNEKFDTKIQPDTVKYNNLLGLQRLIEIFQCENFTKIHIDVFCVVGWAERFYRENPKATKIQMFDELRNPQHFVNLIFAWEGDEQDFKYIMDCLNDRMHKKELGAFYTPPAYCKKATELVRKAISQIPKGNDYIILDRCAGTGNLLEFLTDKNVDEITIAELDKYFDSDFKNRYLQDKSNVISAFYSDKNFNEITLGELEKFKTKINIHNYLFDNELSHTIVNTYELKEWIVLNERIGNKVKMIIPPYKDVTAKFSLVNGGDALSQEFIFGKESTLYSLSKDYFDSINELNSYVNNQNINIIMFENPPYRDMAQDGGKGTAGFVKDIMSKEINGAALNEIGNLFIWSAWKYYLQKENDCFILYSPIKYWKSLDLSNKKFISGYLFNRKHFHATDSAVACVLWKNENETIEEIELQALDIDNNPEVDIKEKQIINVGNIKIKRVHNLMSTYNDKRKFDNDEQGIVCNTAGYEVIKQKPALLPKFNQNIIGYLKTDGFSIGTMSCHLVRVGIHNGHGFYVRSDNFLDKLPIFCAKAFPQKNWYERDIYFTTADGGNRYTKDSEFLKSCLLFTCLSPRNHCLSFIGSDNRFYKNELCFDGDTLAVGALRATPLRATHLQSTETDLLNTFKEILNFAKTTKNYNPKFTYGTYQIDQELNTRRKDETDTIVYDYLELNTKIIALKSKLSKYYEDIIQPKLFEYELLK